MKKLVFWITFPAALVGYTAARILHGSGERAIDACHRFEGWCLGYSDDHVYLGGGLWKEKGGSK